MSETYVPERGDIVWLNFTPQTGHEQAGRRPAVVLSPLNYNHRAGLMICVPITNQVKVYPFEVQLTENKTTGVALADQIKSLDWRARKAERKGQVTPAELAEIMGKLKAVLDY
jgi:mRNA interferase MazF